MSVACICWAHATMRIQDSGLFGEVAKHCAPCLSAFKSLELCNLLWAFAKLGEQSRSSKNLFKAAAGEALSRPDDFSVVNWSTLVWSFATSRVQHVGLFKIVAERISAEAHKAEGQEIANTLWAFATSGVHEEKFMSRMGDEAVQKLSRFKAQELANVAWAFGRARVPHLSFFGALEGHLRGRKKREECIADFEPQHLTMVISAVATLHPINLDSEDIFGEGDEVQESIQEDADGATVVTSSKRTPKPATDVDSARGQCLALGLLVTLLPECVRQVKRFKPDEAARIVKACAKLGLEMQDVPQVDGFPPEEMEEAKTFGARFCAEAPIVKPMSPNVAIGA